MIFFDFKKHIRIFLLILFISFVIIINIIYSYNIKSADATITERFYFIVFENKKLFLERTIEQVLMNVEKDRLNLVELKKNELARIASVLLDMAAAQQWKPSSPNFGEYLRTIEAESPGVSIFLFDWDQRVLAYASRKTPITVSISTGKAFFALAKQLGVDIFHYEVRNGFMLLMMIPNQVVEKEIMAETVTKIRALPEDQGRYIWITKVLDYDGGDDYAVSLVNPTFPNFSRRRLSTNMMDRSGNLPYLRELEGVKEQGDVFQIYEVGLKPRVFKAIRKLSYSRLYKKFDWIVGTGVRLDDIDALVNRTIADSRKRLWSVTLRAMIAVVVLCAVFGAAFFYTGRARYNRLYSQYMRVDKEKERLSVVAGTDALTGGYNRRSAESFLSEAFEVFQREGEVSSVAVVDIDHFKKVNDTYGHDAGDHVLRDLAALLRENTREHDMVGRWGGEEFVLALPKTAGRAAKRASRNLLKRVSERVILYNNVPLRITVTIGVSFFLPTDRTYEDALLRADKALYKGKRRGRNQVVLEPDFRK